MQIETIKKSTKSYALKLFSVFGIVRLLLFGPSEEFPSLCLIRLVFVRISYKHDMNKNVFGLVQPIFTPNWYASFILWCKTFAPPIHVWCMYTHTHKDALTHTYARAHIYITKMEESFLPAVYNLHSRKIVITDPMCSYNMSLQPRPWKTVKTKNLHALIVQATLNIAQTCKTDQAKMYVHGIYMYRWAGTCDMAECKWHAWILITITMWRTKNGNGLS